MQMADTPYQFPDPSGHFGPYGGVFVAETLMPALQKLEAAYRGAMKDPSFRRELHALLRDYVRDLDGNTYDIVVLGHNVGQVGAQLRAYGVTEAVQRG